MSIAIDGEQYEVTVKIASDVDGEVYDVSTECDEAKAIAAETGVVIWDVIQRGETAVQASIVPNKSGWGFTRTPASMRE